MSNRDGKVIAGFGQEWRRFDQSELSIEERRRIFQSYFAIFPWEKLPQAAVGFDLGCGSGRWAQEVATRVTELNCIDPSVEALEVARRNLSEQKNCKLHLAAVDDIPLADDSMDFGYSLGVLHHIPDTEAGLRNCVAKLKRGAPFLVYLYYGFDNRPWWFRAVWWLSNLGRLVISRQPFFIKFVSSQFIAVFVYWPLAGLSRLLGSVGVNVSHIPLSTYRDKSFYVMRTDALDRFGTRLEKRFTRSEIGKMMENAGLERIRFSEQSPYWCAVGFKTAETA